MPAEIQLEDQATRLPLRRLLVIYAGICSAMFISFMDQSAVATAAPVIGSDLRASKTISWVGTSYMVANCTFQLMYGRLSDIFGRKHCLVLSLALLVLGNLLCGFARTAVQLYVFRAISGVGGGGATNLAMIIVSDVVPLKERGKYQSFLSVAISLGNAAGPFIGGGLATAGQWRWLFRVTAILGALCGVACQLTLPLKPVSGSVRTKLAQIDYAGVLLSAAATVLLLVPISGGGSVFAWNGAVVISLLSVGAVCAAAFIVVEWRLARLPVLPMRIFANVSSATAVLGQFCIGLAYYAGIFYIPIYLQYVKACTPLAAGALGLSYSLPQAGWAVVAGWYVSSTNRYKRVVVLGAASWTVSVALQQLWRVSTPLALSMCLLQLQALGIGFVLQPCSVGLAAANTLYQATVKRGLRRVSNLSRDQRKSLLQSSLGFDGLEGKVLHQVKEVYAAGLRCVFFLFLGIVALYLVLTFLIKEVKFRADATELAEKNGRTDVETGKAASVRSEKTEIADGESGKTTSVKSGKTALDSPSLEGHMPTLGYGGEVLSGSSTLVPNTPRPSSETHREGLGSESWKVKTSLEK
ncbi:hypothetical protein Q8F55_005872 [Vanrija albida]|uniref:Major facilitator superfamily (MFS) profile domain-containing protein n=1 Tax=Vanrija albida TaxID=181172 RepID=A0ABR3Q324_9TREE